MSTNYAKQLPRDTSGEPIQLSPPPFVANQRLISENATVSSVITLNDNTTVIEVAAIGVTAVVKFIASTDTQASVISAIANANYDVIIPPNTVRKLVIPQERAGVASIVGAGVQAGTYRRLAWKTAGNGSIMSAEY